MSTRLSKLLKPIQSLLHPGAESRAKGAGAPAAPAAAAGGELLNSAGLAQMAAPVHVQHAWAPEPNAIKLQVNRMLLPLGEKREFADAASAGAAPLVQVLFGLPGIQHVQIESAFITVLMAEDADWDALMEQVPPLIKAHLEAGKPALEEAPRKKFAFNFKQVTARSAEEQFEIVKRLIDDEINPAVAAHGGNFKLLDVRDNRVFVKLGGGCQGCGQVDVTLRQGVEQRLKEVLPEIVALIDVTDHAQGENPYYQPDAHAGHQH